MKGPLPRVTIFQMDYMREDNSYLSDMNEYSGHDGKMNLDIQNFLCLKWINSFKFQ